MPKISCGLLVYRRKDNQFEFFLEHPGGPFFTHKDNGSWTIPKGEVEPNEELLAAAFRETHEETGQIITGTTIPLNSIKTPNKTYYAWAIEADIDPLLCNSNQFELNGKSYPEVDRYAWFDLDLAKIKINQNLLPFLEEFIKTNPTP